MASLVERLRLRKDLNFPTLIEAADEIERAWTHEAELTAKINRLCEEIGRLHTFEAERDAEIERLKNSQDDIWMQGYFQAALSFYPIVGNLLNHKDHHHGP